VGYCGVVVGVTSKLNKSTSAFSFGWLLVAAAAGAAVLLPPFCFLTKSHTVLRVATQSRIAAGSSKLRNVKSPSSRSYGMIEKALPPPSLSSSTYWMEAIGISCNSSIPAA